MSLIDYTAIIFQATVLLSDPLKNEQNVEAIFTALDCILGQFDQADLQQVAYVGKET